MPSAEQISAVRRDVEEVCRILTAPSAENLHGCTGVLERAVGSLGGRGRDTGGVEMEEWRRLRVAIGRATQLLHSAREFHTRWNQVLGGMLGGYTVEGRSAEVPGRTRIWVTG